MKFFKLFLTLLFLIAFINSTYAQFNVLEKVKKKVNKTVEKNIDEQINKTVNETEKEIKNGGSKEKNEPKDKIQEQKKSEVLETEENSKELKLWSKYNFIPGDKIIFEDNLTSEESGEFPSRWDLLAGNAENASLGEENVINFAQNNTSITPLMRKEKYLPDVFTIEFDVYFHKLAHKRSQNYSIQFWTNSQNRPRGKDKKLVPPIIFKWNDVIMGSFRGKADNTKEARKNWKGQWKHIAISFNKRSLKVFLDEKRMLNIPNLGFIPKVFSIQGNYDDRYVDISAIKNIRIAEGGKKLYDRVMANGKFVTRGILFDVNKSSIKPESMGVLNEIAKMMKKYDAFKFSIEGHTDGDGEQAYNQKLSEQRAESVKNALVKLGIAESRFETKGYGETFPVDNNRKPEGKANNRRVEFIRI